MFGSSLSSHRSVRSSSPHNNQCGVFFELGIHHTYIDPKTKDQLDKDKQMTEQHNSVLDIVNKLSEPERGILMKELYGAPSFEEITVPEDLKAIIEEQDIEVAGYKIPCPKEEIRKPRVIRIAAIQNKIVAPTTAPFEEQWTAIRDRISDLIDAAGAMGANIICLQECWTTPFTMCTREKHWCQMATPAGYGPVADFISEKAKQHHAVIISPILERDEDHEDSIWNTCSIFNANGVFIGKTRKNHIPRVGDFNEANYYTEAQDGHPVFEVNAGNGVTAKIGVNICYGRHHPLNWMGYALNGAEIIFNPSATIAGLSEPMWSIEARNAAIANSAYTVAINRVGTEVFPREFTSGDGKPAHRDFGHFYGSSYVAAPNSMRTPPLSRTMDGVLISEVDLNLCRQIRDGWMFNVTMRPELYADLLTRYCQHDFKPQRVIDPSKPRKR
eukprot:gnl/Dysnectes_brevis/313_a347_3817.p2 GENE.gnl/Dysnectes_brevis/313_a347_3817~~gnl/Dysnectes_brevis/313_a347_3817.p2  ORF type:complete len:443 (+),score=115.61 gnl/Dysnectes_brevis/313_a347_3817:1801-3129(+)